MNLFLPKVLIIGESFNKKSGGGITLSSLFANWPKENIAVIASPKSIFKSDINKAIYFYKLGYENQRLIFPFFLLQKKYKSGIFTSLYNNKNFNKNNKFKIFNKKYIFNLLHFLGIFPLIERYYIDENLINFINEFNPNFIYTQLSTRVLINLVYKIYKITNIPIIVHIMDDWPRTINKPGILKKFWDRKIDKEFRRILSISKARLAISESMAIEYSKRYGYSWKYFHNPIVVEEWSKHLKKEYSVRDTFKIFYMGRIGLATYKEILKLIKSVEILSKSGVKIEFHIYSSSNIDNLVKKGYRATFFYDIVDHTELPKRISKYDLLYLPLDRDRFSIKFTKFSMPTKTSEYMISGVPILLNVPKVTGLYKYFSERNCAFIFKKKTYKELADFIREIIKDEANRKKYGKTAYKIAKKEFDSKNVLEDFQNVFK